MIRDLQTLKWHYREQMKSNLEVYTGSNSTFTIDIAKKARKKRKHGLYLSDPVYYSSQCVETYMGSIMNLGMISLRIIAMDVPPTDSRVLEYGLRWTLISLFSDFKTTEAFFSQKLS